MCLLHTCTNNGKGSTKVLGHVFKQFDFFVWQATCNMLVTTFVFKDHTSLSVDQETRMYSLCLQRPFELMDTDLPNCYGRYYVLRTHRHPRMLFPLDQWAGMTCYNCTQSTRCWLSHSSAKDLHFRDPVGPTQRAVWYQSQHWQYCGQYQ